MTMNAPVQAPAASAAAVSTFDQLKETTLNAVNWMGKNIQQLGSNVKDYSLKVVEWAKPFFQNLVKMFAETFDKVKAFVLANKQVSIAVGVAIPVIAGLTIFASKLCENKSEAPAAT